MAKFTLSLNGPLINIPSNLYKRGFDYVSRYRLIAEIIVRYSDKINKPKSILDVGGRGTLLTELLDIPIHVLDAEDDDPSVEELGDGSDMNNIKDGSYDAVVTSDTLEHIPQKDRANFIKELFRVSNDLVILCAPFGDHGAAGEEHKVHNLYTAFMGKKHRWLTEHADFILPREKETSTLFNSLSKSYISFGHTDVRIYRQILSAVLTANEVGGKLLNVASKVNEFYNKNLTFNDFSTNSYRTFFIASKKHNLSLVIEDDQRFISGDNALELSEILQDFYDEIIVDPMLIPSVSHRALEAKQESDRLERQYKDIINSRSWRYTSGLRGLYKHMRFIQNIFRRIRRHVTK